MTSCSSFVPPRGPRCVIVLPCLNEEDHIGVLLETLAVSADAMDCEVIVMDGGSTDATPTIVLQQAALNPRIRLMQNPRKIQSAAINSAVASLDGDVEFLIRIDAHGSYPAGYCEALLEEAKLTGADSVVVSMLTVGERGFQRAVAVAQNSRLGTGGAHHRVGSQGRWVDHGHHALIRVSSFRTIGGYDETFSHNEDAEFDVRLIQAGYRIWITDRTRMIYFPRNNPKALFRQYVGYGRGRAKNTIKHRTVPKLRQMIPLSVGPAVLLVLMAPFHLFFALPAAVWVGACLVLSLFGEERHESWRVALAAMMMHLAWSCGFWIQVADLLWSNKFRFYTFRIGARPNVTT